MISVLLVDDEPVILSVSRLFLEQIGDFSISTTGSVENANELMKNQKFDVIVSDYQMSPTNGLDFLRDIRKKSDIPFILFTGKGREDVIIEAMNSGASFYLQKGGSPKACFRELARLIEQAANFPRSSGAIKFGSKNFITALDCFENARKNNPNIKTVITDTLIAKINNGKINEALQDCDLILLSNPKLSEIWLLKAFLVGMGDFQLKDPSHDVFISHSIEDKKIAHLLCQHLEENGIKCWIAPRDIPTGRVWFEEIPGAIHDTKIVILLLSQNSNNSDNVMREIVTACNSDCKIFPVRIEKIEPSAGLKFLITIWQYIDIFPGDMNENIQPLIKQLKSELQK